VKNDRYLRGLYARPEPRRSTFELRTPLLIAAGVIGVPLAIGLAYRALADDREDVTSSSSSTPAVDTATAYPMNHFLPGAGYYHAPYHAWFPMPFNFHDNSRGWFRGGQWRTTPMEDEAERRDAARTSGFVSSRGYVGGNAARVMTSRPNPEAVQRANAGALTHHKANVIRGGFGSSSRPGIT
jgi:hypothetical protein